MREDNDNNAGTSNGHKGKFIERILNIRKQKFKSKKMEDIDEESKVITIGRNFFKVILALPSVIYANVLSDKDKNYNNEDKKQKDILSRSSVLDKNTVDVRGVVIKNKKVISNYEKNMSTKSYDINYTALNKKSNSSYRNVSLSKNRQVSKKNSGFSSLKKRKKTNINEETSLKKIELQKDIIKLIKNKLVKNINELEILQSELYILNQLDQGDIYLDECLQDIKEVKKLLSKVKALKEKYDYLKDNVDFENVFEYDDGSLMDKIIELKEICSICDIHKTIDDYKILEEYKYLYLKIDKLQDDIIKLDEYKSNKEKELKERDIDFSQFKDNLFNADLENDKYNNFVKEQEVLINELENSISHIDSYEAVTYRLKGFNKLLGNSFKFLGLLLVNPLKGLIPGIATQTIITKNVIGNLYHNLHWEENRRMVYESIDYSATLNMAISNLNNTGALIDSTLEDITSLKREYQEKFSKYSSSFSDYREALKKLNKIENAVLGSKIKVNIMMNKMKENQKKNDNKLKIVKRLNNKENN